MCFFRKKMQDFIGFSLIEFLFVLGLTSLVSFSTMKLMENQNKSIKNYEQRTSVNDFEMGIKTYLIDKNTCEKNFKGLTLSSTPQKIPSASIKDLSDKVLISVGQKIENTILVEALEYENSTLALNKAEMGIISFVIRFLKTDMNGNTIKSFKKIPLQVSIDSANNILSCYSDVEHFVASSCSILGGTIDPDCLKCNVEIGAVMAFNLDTCPEGWLPSDGTNGTQDLRGKFLRGVGGNSSGRGIVQSDGIKNHKHPYSLKHLHDKRDWEHAHTLNFNIHTPDHTHAMSGLTYKKAEVGNTLSRCWCAAGDVVQTLSYSDVALSGSINPSGGADLSIHNSTDISSGNINFEDSGKNKTEDNEAPVLETRPINIANLFCQKVTWSQYKSVKGNCGS